MERVMKNSIVLACAILAAVAVLPHAPTPPRRSLGPVPVASAPYETATKRKRMPATAPGTVSEAPDDAPPAKIPDPVTLSQDSIDPGETLILTLNGVDPSTVTVTSGFNYAVHFAPMGGDAYIGFLPLSYFTQPGNYTVRVQSAALPGGGVSFPVTVTNKAFDVQRITVDETVAGDTIFNDQARLEYRQRIWPMKEIYDNNKYFDGRFILPVEGRLTTQFGMVRYVNGQANPRHDGVDIAAGTGTPVKCAQKGRVLFADFVKLTGNTVIVEHGGGLKSWYQHMDSLSVKEGDRVETGGILGKVGATGFVTGPHLHFSASVNGVYINPFTLIDSDLLERVAG